MRIVVVGAGAMGCLYGGLLHRAGHDVTLVDVSARQIEAIDRDGLVIEMGGEEVVVPIRAAYASEVTQAPEALFVFTKTTHTSSALESARPFLGPETTLVSLQNGLGNVELMEAFAPRERIVVGVTTFPADLVSPGRIHTRGGGQTKIMSADGALTGRLHELRDALDEAGFDCHIVPDVQVAIWEKAAFNAGLNTVAAVTRFPVGRMADSPHARRLAELVVREVTGVARAKGIAADTEAVLETVTSALAGHREHKPSMLQDMLAGRRTEIEALNGAVVREAEALGMTVPATEALYLLISALEAAPAGPEAAA